MYDVMLKRDEFVPNQRTPLDQIGLVRVFYCSTSRNGFIAAP
jgi:hypothetical protein